MDRISESSEPDGGEGSDTYDDIIHEPKSPHSYRRGSINLAHASLGISSHGRSFLTRGPNLLQVPEISRLKNQNTRRRHSWIPGSR